jgi:hypothetical protein
MALKYALTENLLTADPNDYMAVTTDNPTVGTGEIIDRMISRGSTVTKAEAFSVMEEFYQAVVDAIKAGNNVSTDLFTIYPSISGVFNSSSEAFNTNKHAINIKMRAGSRFKDIHRQIALERVEANENKPIIQQVTDLKTGAVNDTVTVGQIISIKGALLKISEEEKEAGIFIIGEGTPETRVTQIVKNKPAELLFFIPAGIGPGSCTIEIRTFIRGHKTISVTRCPFELTATA